VNKQAGNPMSMAINRISASGVAGMLYGMPVNKPGQVTNVAPGDRTNVAAAGTSSQAVQRVSGPQFDTPSTRDQLHTAFQHALAALSSVAAGTMAESSTPDQSSGLQQGAAYAQVEQQVGQVLDITA
jgi:hypothetical protein